ncbi:MAG: ATP-binding protein [Blautia sp.]
MVRFYVPNILQTHIMILYWCLIAAGLVLYTRKKIEKTYEIPLQKISEATKKVAHGDFSVYIPTINTPDKLDYLDVMIMDLNRMVEELGSIETLKTDFISNVSHEMKTPIAVIKNSAQLLQMKGTSEEQRLEYAKNIDSAAGRLSDLITNILKLNKLENQNIVPETEAYDVCRQLCDCIIQFEDRWERKEIELDIDLEERAFVQADQELMELVWNNLLSNALKFTEPGGQIIIRQTSEQGWVRVSVSDTGCGMSEDTVKHIFDKFYQGDTSHSKEGNGLGMALVHRVIQLLDGEIQVVSEVGKGSVFSVKLPSEHGGE